MPTYEYKCKACNKEFEYQQRMSDPELEVCEACGEKALERLLSAPAFHLKGGGWYKDLYSSTKPDAKSGDSTPSSGAASTPSTPGTSATPAPSSPASGGSSSGSGSTGGGSSSSGSSGSGSGGSTSGGGTSSGGGSSSSKAASGAH